MVEQEEYVAELKRVRLGPVQKIALSTIAVIFMVSIVCRVAFGGGAPERTSYSGGALPAGAQGFVSGENTPIFLPTETGETQEDSGAIESVLPVLTEASFFAMIGFALGYASRKVVKLGLIVLAGFFVMLQLLTYGGVTTIDWGRFVDILNDWVLNLKENQTITDVLTDRVPTAGSLVAGYFLGFRKG